MLERLDGLLLNLVARTNWFGQVLRFNSEARSQGYTLNSNELRAQLKNLRENGYLTEENRTGTDPEFVCSLTAEGLARANELKGRHGSDSNKAFVAMWFDNSMDKVFEDGIAKAITDCGFEANRVDRVEHNDLIDDQIIVGLRECRFVVAEYTRNRNGVYYEAGYAHGMGKTVIMCCREEDKESIHFDVNHRNFILYQSPEDLAEKLRPRILATVGRGRNQTNIPTGS